MKYPDHLILDLVSLKRKPNCVTWDDDYRSNIQLESLLLRAKRPLRLLPIVPSYQKSKPNTAVKRLASTTMLFDINFLIKDQLYTKLKYSRCPQYDIVSGGFAAVLAGFIGFLISEKFGIELVDSGDFYTAFMYAVFLAFALRSFIFNYSKEYSRHTSLSPKFLFDFWRTVITVFIAAPLNSLWLLSFSTRSLLTKISSPLRAVLSAISSKLRK